MEKAAGFTMCCAAFSCELVPAPPRERNVVAPAEPDLSLSEHVCASGREAARHTHVAHKRRDQEMIQRNKSGPPKDRNNGRARASWTETRGDAGRE